MQRRYLALIALAVMMVSAGCLDANATATFDEVNETEVAERATIHVDGLEEEAAQAIANGTSDPTIRELPREVQVNRKKVLADSGVYTLEQQQVGTINVTRITVSVKETNASADMSYSNLSDRDAELVESAVRLEFDRNREREVRAVNIYEPDELTNSVFANETSVRVAFEGSVYRLTVESRDTDEREQYVYEATERIAPSAAAYGQQLIDEHAFTLRDPPEKGKSVLNEAVTSGGYYGDESDGFVALEDRFEEESPVFNTEHRSDWLVRYNGTLYWATFRS